MGFRTLPAVFVFVLVLAAQGVAKEKDSAIKNNWAPTDIR